MRLCQRLVYIGSACGARAVGWGVKQFTQAAEQATRTREQQARQLFNYYYGAAANGLELARAAVASFIATIEAARVAGLAAVQAAYPTFNL